MGAKKKKSSKQGANFAVTLITLSLVFVFFGYLIGTYLVGALQKQHQVSLQSSRQGVTVSAPAAPKQPDPPVTSTPVPQSQVAQEVPSAPPASPAPTPAQSEALYRVQVGVFSEKANADRMVAMLKDAGYEGMILSGPPYRVQTGAFSSQDNATKLVNELKQKGFEAIIVR